jgi:hypothetical protein
MFHPTTSSRLPWSPSPKRNQFRERRSSVAESHSPPSAYDYQNPRAPSSQYIKRKASKGYYYPQPGPYTRPRSSSLLERVELPSEERSLLDRMDVNEEALNNGSKSDSLQGWITRSCGSQAQTYASPERSESPRMQNGSSVCCWPRVQPRHKLTLYTPISVEEHDQQ